MPTVCIDAVGFHLPIPTVWGRQRSEAEQVLPGAARRKVTQSLTQETVGKLPLHCTSVCPSPPPSPWPEVPTTLGNSCFCCGNDTVKLCWQNYPHPSVVPTTAGKKPHKADTVLNNIPLITYLLLEGFILLVNPVSRSRISNSLQWKTDNAQ